MNSKYSDMEKFYFEIRIFPNAFFDIFVSEIAEFTSQAIEENNENGRMAIIIRTNENIESKLTTFLNTLCKNLSDINTIDVSYEYSILQCEIKDYIESYKQSIQGLECNEFYIHPSWINPKDAKINIILEPSLAFGTGHHASTFMSIEAISECIKDKHKPTMLDVGCGSGILSLCAYKLGADVSLCDIDDLAINEAKKNFLINNATITDIWLGSLGSTKQRYDIVVANIVASVIIDQAENLLNALKENSYLILSGILDEYKDLVKNKFKHLQLIQEKSKDEWVTLVFLAPSIKEINEKQ